MQLRGIHMEKNSELLKEIYNMLKVLTDGQEQLQKDIKELREEQKRLKEEVKFSNFVLHNMGLRNEIAN
jgi:cell division protein FtsB